MNEHGADPLDMLAAEYVIGTLRGARCEQFEARMRSEPEVARRVREWEARLAPLAEGYAPSDAPEQTWAAIERRLFSSARAPASGLLAFWRRLALGLGAIATAFIAAGVYLLASEQAPQCYAVLTDERNLPAVVVFDRRNMRELVVLPVGTRLVSGSGSAQLWIVAGAHATPVGLLSADGETRLALDKPMTTAVMAADARLLVTREPPGGSPSGRPHGQRIAEGAVALLGASPSKASAI